MGLSLVAGPAHAGKVALLLERYVDVLDRDPWLVVPNRGDVDRVERDLLARVPALVAGRIGTFDDLFRHIVRGHSERRPEADDTQRMLAVRRALAAFGTAELGPSARTPGFLDVLAGALGELESGLVDESSLDGLLAGLMRAYRAELDRVGLWDRFGLRRRAVEHLASDLAAWRGEPVFAYGFEDLTEAEWALIEALAGRTDVTVSLPYEPGRAAFASLRRTAGDLQRLSAGNVVELPSGSERHLPAALAYLERHLFESTGDTPPSLDGVIRFFEGAGTRATAELVGQEIASLVRAGTRPEEIGVVVDSHERWVAPLEVAFGSLEIPWALDGRVRFGSTTFGGALLGLARFALLAGDRGDLFSFLRSPFSGLQRSSVDFVEGRLRGRAVSDPARVEAESEKLRGDSLPLVAAVRAADSALEGVRLAAESMAVAAYGLTAPPVGDVPNDDLRALDAARRLLESLAAFEESDGSVLRAEEVVQALERATVRPAGAGEAGRVALLDLMHARTRRYDVVFVLGLEEGSFPRRSRASALLDDDRRRALGSRLERPDPVERDRYLFYTACTRPRSRLVLVREAVDDDGSPRQASPFWDEVLALFPQDDVTRWTRRRPLSALTWQLETAPSDRDRLRAVASLSSREPAEAEALARANGWERRLDRARSAFRRPTELRNPVVRESLEARTTFSVTELERFADCSAAWFVERVIDPKRIDAEPDAMLRGQVAHTTLHRFYGSLQKELGVERVTEENLDDALALIRRCLDDALATGVRFELTDLQAAELRTGLVRDLEGFVRDEAVSAVTLVPRRLEVSFGTDRAAPELQRGLTLDDGLTLSGKIDRIDIDANFSARGIVQDYKSGKGAYSAREIDSEVRFQIPLYLLVLRDLVGIEPLGGVYRALAGKRLSRGMLRSSAADDLPGFSGKDYLDEDAFWSQVETARERAAGKARRIQRGDVRHDPKDGECPSWCDLWPVCRIERP